MDKQIKLAKIVADVLNIHEEPISTGNPTIDISMSELMLICDKWNEADTNVNFKVVYSATVKSEIEYLPQCIYVHLQFIRNRKEMFSIQKLSSYGDSFMWSNILGNTGDYHVTTINEAFERKKRIGGVIIRFNLTEDYMRFLNLVLTKIEYVNSNNWEKHTGKNITVHIKSLRILQTPLIISKCENKKLFFTNGLIHPRYHPNEDGYEDKYDNLAALQFSNDEKFIKWMEDSLHGHLD